MIQLEGAKFQDFVEGIVLVEECLLIKNVKIGTVKQKNGKMDVMEQPMDLVQEQCLMRQ